MIRWTAMLLLASAVVGCAGRLLINPEIITVGVMTISTQRSRAEAAAVEALGLDEGRLVISRDLYSSAAAQFNGWLDAMIVAIENRDNASKTMAQYEDRLALAVRANDTFVTYVEQSRRRPTYIFDIAPIVTQIGETAIALYKEYLQHEGAERRALADQLKKRLEALKFRRFGDIHEGRRPPTGM